MFYFRKILKILIITTVFFRYKNAVNSFGMNLMKVPDNDMSQWVCPMALLQKYYNSGEALSGSVLYMSLTAASLYTQKKLLEALHAMKDFPWSVVICNPKSPKSSEDLNMVLHEKPQCYFVVIENLDDDDLEYIFEYWKLTVNWNPIAQFVVYLASVEETDEEMTELMGEILLNFMHKRIYNVNVIGQSEESGYFHGKTVLPYHPDNNCGQRVTSIETLDVCDYGVAEKTENDNDENSNNSADNDASDSEENDNNDEEEEEDENNNNEANNVGYDEENGGDMGGKENSADDVNDREENESNNERVDMPNKSNEKKPYEAGDEEENGDNDDKIGDRENKVINNGAEDIGDGEENVANKIDGDEKSKDNENKTEGINDREENSNNDDHDNEENKGNINRAEDGRENTSNKVKDGEENKTDPVNGSGDIKEEEIDSNEDRKDEENEENGDNDDNHDKIGKKEKRLTNNGAKNTRVFDKSFENRDDDDAEKADKKNRADNIEGGEENDNDDNIYDIKNKITNNEANDMRKIDKNLRNKDNGNEESKDNKNRADYIGGEAKNYGQDGKESENNRKEAKSVKASAERSNKKNNDVVEYESNETNNVGIDDKNVGNRKSIESSKDNENKSENEATKTKNNNKLSGKTVDKKKKTLLNNKIFEKEYRSIVKNKQRSQLYKPNAAINEFKEKSIENESSAEEVHNFDRNSSNETKNEPRLYFEELFRASFLDKFPKDLSGCPLATAYRTWEPYIFTETAEGVQKNTTKDTNDYDNKSDDDSKISQFIDSDDYDADSNGENDHGVNLIGIEYQLLQTISERLHISIEFQAESRNLYYLFQKLVDGEIEMVIGGIDEDPNMSQYVSTTIPYHQDDLTWCVAKAKRSHRLFNFLASFSAIVWIFFFLYIVVASLTITFAKCILRLRLKQLNGFFSTMFRVFSILFNQPLPFVIKESFLRSIFLPTFYLAVIFINAYQSFLVSTLTTPKSTFQISRLEEIYKNRMIIKGSVEDVRHLNKEGEIFKYIREKFQICYNIEKCLMEAAENENIAVAVSRQHSFYNPRIPRNRLYCFDRNENLYIYLVTILLPKKFHLLHKINPVIQHVIESGHMEKWARDLDMRRRILEERNHVHEEKFRSLTLGQVAGTFVFTGTLLGIAFMALMLELCVCRLSTKRRRTRLKLIKFLHRQFLRT